MKGSQITVYTAAFGLTDPLQEPRVSSAANFVCFTDDPRLRSKRWRIVVRPKTDTPTREARRLKALSHRFTDTEWSLWVDCNYIIRVDPLTLLEYGEMVNFIHPTRNTLKAEGAAIIAQGKARPSKVRAQLNAYRREGFPVDGPTPNGLSSTSVTLRRHTAKICRINEIWQKQLDRYTLRDQLCVDYAAWKEGYKIARWPGTYKANPYFKHVSFTRPVNDF